MGSTLDDRLDTLLDRDDLSNPERAKAFRIWTRWQKGIVPSSTDMHYVEDLWNEKTSVYVCRYLRNKRCLHKERQDPIDGAMACDHLENQTKCRIYGKGDIA